MLLPSKVSGEGLTVDNNWFSHCWRRQYNWNIRSNVIGIGEKSCQIKNVGEGLVQYECNFSRKVSPKNLSSLKCVKKVDCLFFTCFFDISLFLKTITNHCSCLDFNCLWRFDFSFSRRFRSDISNLTNFLVTFSSLNCTRIVQDLHQHFVFDNFFLQSLRHSTWCFNRIVSSNNVKTNCCVPLNAAPVGFEGSDNSTKGFTHIIDNPLAP